MDRIQKTLVIGCYVVSASIPGTVFAHRPPQGSLLRWSSYQSEEVDVVFVKEDDVACGGGETGRLRTALSLFVHEGVTIDSTVDGGTPRVARALTASVDIVQRCGLRTTMISWFQGSTDVWPEEVVLDGVNSGTVTVSLQLFDQEGNVANLDVAVDLNGVGSPNERSRIDVDQWNDETVRYDYLQYFRSATAAGTVSLDGREFTDSLDHATLATSARRVLVFEGMSPHLVPNVRVVPGPGSVIDGLSIHTEAASAHFLQREGSVCADGTSGIIERTFVVDAYPDVRIENGVRSSYGRVVASVFEVDSCASGRTSVLGSATAPLSGFRSAPLRSASLRTTLELVTETGGTPIGTLEVDLAWKGVGETSRYMSFIEESIEPRTRRELSDGSGRDATVSGRLTFDGLDLIPFFSSATLNTREFRTITTER